MNRLVVGCALVVLGVGACDSNGDSGASTPPIVGAPAAPGPAQGGTAAPAEPPPMVSGGSGAPGTGMAGAAVPVAGSVAAGGAGGQGAGMAGAGGNPDVPNPDEGWEMIITADWELPANQEAYYCQRLTLKEDLYFNAIRAVNPQGTHHTAFTVESNPTRPDGLSTCNSGGLAPQGIFGSGVGTDPVTYPEGVGMRLRAGQQLLLNLHVFNVTDQPLTGTSGTAVKKTTADKIQHVAESLLAGPALFSLPMGRTSVSGTCTMTHDVTLFAVQPHMHQTGVHMKGVAHSSSAGDVMVHDGPFEFENQIVYEIAPLQMNQGDVIDIECTFDNMTDGPIGFGESSNDEMCFMVLHRYPAAQNPSVTCFF